MKAILLEFYKLRHRYLFLMVTSFILVEILFLFISISRSISQNPENANWNALIVMFASLNGLIFPILIAIIVSRICDMEHKGDTWKLVRSLSVNHDQIYGAKYICASIFVLFACIIQVLSIAVLGIFRDFQNSVLIFLSALSLGMIGGFIGMTADLMPSGIRNLFVWSYYSRLSPVALTYESEILDFIIRGMSILLPTMFIVAIDRMRKSDVVA